MFSFMDIIAIVALVVAVIDCVASVIFATVGSLIEHRERKKRNKEEQIKKEALEILEETMSNISVDAFEKPSNDFQEFLNKINPNSETILNDIAECIENEGGLITEMLVINTSFSNLVENNLFPKSCYFTTTQTQLLMNIIEKYRHFNNEFVQYNNFVCELGSYYNEKVVPFFCGKMVPDFEEGTSDEDKEKIINNIKQNLFNNVVDNFKKSVTLLNETISSINSLNEELYLLKLTFGSESIQKLSKTE